MKKIFIVLGLATAILHACSSSDSRSNKTADTTLRLMIKPFSDSLKADTFFVRSSSENAKEASLVFTINSHEGREIYHKEIAAKDLFSNYNATIDLNKKKNQVKFLNEEIGRFFDEENFMEPAITEQETSDQNVPDLEFYNELKKSQLNGFIYRLGKENKVYIGWSEKDKKVKVYYQCCKH